MILERLKELAERVRDEIPPFGYATTKIRWIIELDTNGKLLGATKTEGERGKPKFVERMAPNPNLTGKRASNIKAGLLADTAEYALCIPSEKKAAKTERLAEMHKDFCENVVACADLLDMPELKAILSLLQRGTLAEHPLLKEIDGGDWVTFRVGGSLPIDDPRVQEYWDKSQRETQRSGDCMVCGTASVPLIDLQPVALKPVPGGQSAGVQLISANTDVFESYGLESALIAPMCRPCAELSHNAINYLINSNQHSYRVRDQAVFLFWTRKESQFSIPALFGEPTEDSVKALMASPHTGHAYAPDLVKANAFYMLALSGSGGRAVVRDWIETSLNVVQENLKHYFHAQHIAGGRKPYQKLMDLAEATVRVSDDLAPWVSISLVEHALKGTPLPPALLSIVVRRCAVGKVDRHTRKRKHVNEEQAALVKLCLISLSHQKGNVIKEDWMIKLDPNYPEPAYHYGRLYYVLQWLQEEAKTGGDSVERSFGTAMVMPQSAFRRFLGRVSIYTGKLARSKDEKKAGYFKRMISDIQNKIGPESAYKQLLDAHEQGLFALGYWHQNAARFEKRGDTEIQAE